MFTLNETWQKATRSGTNGQCVEVRLSNANHVQVRNSNDLATGSVSFTRQEWATFIDAVAEDGEFRIA